MMCQINVSDKENKDAIFEIYSLEFSQYRFIYFYFYFFLGISSGKLKSSLIFALVLYLIIIV